MPFPRWSALRHAAIHRMSDDDVRWRSLGALFIAGGTLALVSLLLPVGKDSEILAVFLVGVSAVGGGIGMIALATRLPRGDRWLSPALGCGTILVALAVAFNHQVASPYSLVYIWVGFIAFFFLTRHAAFGHLGFVGFTYAAVLVLEPHQGEAHAARWLMLMGTVGVIGFLADLLRTRSDSLIAKLGEMARTDSLTALLNRRGFEEQIADELHRARRSGTSVSIVVGDLDHFKSVNDRFGHHRGDEALRQFSDLAMGTKRVVDSAARIGGEEFALVLPDTDEHGAFLLAERLRRRVRETLVDYGPPLSMSFGVASFPRHGTTPDDVLRAADKALYLAKRLGRDRSVIYSSEVSAGLRATQEPRTSAAEQLPAVLILAETLDLRDTGTALHSQTVGHYAESIAAAMGLPERRVERIRLAGLLHDIGKIGISDDILRKPGPLDDDEWAEMRKHPELGARILAGANLDDISAWVLAHHERPDGSGYPSRLIADEIPLEARILSVADSFEAMTSKRIYREALGADVAIKELRRHAGSQFDLEVVETFLTCLGRQASSSVPTQMISATTATPASNPASTR